MSSKSSAVSNSGPLIHLGKAGLIDLLLALYEVYIPEEVKGEVVDVGKEKGYLDALLIETKIRKGKIKVMSKKISQEFLELAEKFGVHPVEAEVIYVAKEEGWIALLDDEPARQFARILGVRVRGSMGLLIEAIGRGLISYEKAVEKLNELSQIMYLSSEAYQEALKEIKEEREKKVHRSF